MLPMCPSVGMPDTVSILLNNFKIAYHTKIMPLEATSCYALNFLQSIMPTWRLRDKIQIILKDGRNISEQQMLTSGMKRCQL